MEYNKYVKYAIVLTVATIAIACFYTMWYNSRDDALKVLNEGQKLEDVAPSIKKQVQEAEQDGAVLTTAKEIASTAKREQAFRKAEYAVIEGNTKLPPSTPVELKQYNVYTAPKVIREAGLCIGSDKKIDGVSFGIKKRISKKGTYIGVRVDYEWTDKRARVWATYSW